VRSAHRTHAHSHTHTRTHINRISVGRIMGASGQGEHRPMGASPKEARAPCGHFVCSTCAHTQTNARTHTHACTHRISAGRIHGSIAQGKASPVRQGKARDTSHASMVCLEEGHEEATRRKTDDEAPCCGKQHSRRGNKHARSSSKVRGRQHSRTCPPLPCAPHPRPSP
jgi:hypothetical protein